MSVRNQTGTFWPSALQERLLVVALEQPDEAVEAWREVRPLVVLDRLEPGSFKLMPLIYRNLRLTGYEEPELPRLKGIYRRTWVKNNLLTERTSEIGKAFVGAGIPALFIEGATFAARFYGELGLRPTTFIDIFVEEEDSRIAVALLARAGWTESRGTATASRGEARHLFDEHRNVCSLRSRLSIDCIERAPSNKTYTQLWRSQEQYSAQGVALRVTPPTETLFAVCVSHARVENPPNIQWIADAKMVLDAEIDWPRFLALAKESGQVSRLRDALEYLRGLPGRKPPQEICDRLASTKISKRERLSYLCTSGSIRGPGSSPLLVAEHLSATAHRTFLGTIATFPAFLRDRWKLARTWQVPAAASGRMFRLFGSRKEVG